jgi:hypothetical protein
MPRAAIITNCRPAAMVQWERDHGFDHGKRGLDALGIKTTGAAK